MAKSFLDQLSEHLPGGRLRRAFHNTDRFSAVHPDSHWVLDEFPLQSGPVQPGFWICPVGSRTRAAHIELPADYPGGRAGPIEFDAEYFEWTDIKEAVLEAGDTFTFLELGAGYGRWTSRAAGAARMKGKRFRCALAEPDPRNAARAREHMADNGIDDYRLFEAAVGGARRKSALAVGAPPAYAPAGEWYGQSIGWGEVPADQAAGDYFGRPAFVADGWRFVEVDEIPLTDVLAPFNAVDLIDMDIQGAEAAAVRAGIDALTATTRRLHIETHNHAVEADLRDSLSSAGWRRLRDYEYAQENQTAFGACYMEGGVQSWINPKRL